MIGVVTSNRWALGNRTEMGRDCDDIEGEEEEEKAG
jgi:hypothetical protein